MAIKYLKTENYSKLNSIFSKTNLNYYRYLDKMEEQMKKDESKTKSAQVTSIEPGTPGGRGEPCPQYNTTGNDFWAGGPNAVPSETRVEQLIKIIKKNRKKKEGNIS